tara:strand:+ start:1956 stop:2126 length:171 start_codon:yes stop_codon:yes gene_type:complete
MEVGDLVKIADKFGKHHFGVITDTVIMDEVLFVVTFFDGSEVIIHPSRIGLLKEET